MLLQCHFDSFLYATVMSLLYLSTLLTHSVQHFAQTIGAILSEPRMYEKYSERICIYALALVIPRRWGVYHPYTEANTTVVGLFHRWGCTSVAQGVGRIQSSIWRDPWRALGAPHLSGWGWEGTQGRMLIVTCGRAWGRWRCGPVLVALSCSRLQCTRSSYDIAKKTS